MIANAIGVCRKFRTNQYSSKQKKRKKENVYRPFHLSPSHCKCFSQSVIAYESLFHDSASLFLRTYELQRRTRMVKAYTHVKTIKMRHARTKHVWAFAPFFHVSRIFAGFYNDNIRTATDFDSSTFILQLWADDTLKYITPAPRIGGCLLFGLALFSCSALLSTCAFLKVPLALFLIQA